MVMRAMREGAFGGVMKFILFGLLLLAVCGLALMDVGGFFRNGGVKNTDAAKIGQERLSIQSFSNNVRRNLQRVGTPPEEAYKLGYIDEMLNAEIRSSLMYQAATKLGVRVGTPRIAKQVHTMIEPMIQNGETAQSVLDKVLQAQGMSEGELVYSMQREGASGILNAAVQSGFGDVSDDMLQDLYMYKNETRMINLAVFMDKDLKDVKAPTDEELQKLYDSIKESYAIPESRSVVLAIVQADKVKSSVSVSDADIKSAYDESIDTYTTPEQRVVEQAILKNEADAKAVLEKVNGGAKLQDAALEVSKDKLSYVGGTAFEKEGLLPQVADIVFGQKELNKPMGPIKTDLGWHIIIMKEIKAPSVKPLAAVHDDIAKELKANKQADAAYDVANAVDDQMAGGARIEDAAKQNDLKLVTLPSLNTLGQDQSGNDALKDFTKDHTLIIKTAFDLSEGETSNVMEMPDGSLMAINVKSIAPKSYKPFADVKQTLSNQWIGDQRRADNRMKAMSLLAQIKSGSVSLKTLAAENNVPVRTIANIKRDGNIPAPLNAKVVPLIFESPVGDYALLAVDGGAAIAEVVESKFPKPDSIDKKSLEALRADYLKSVQSEGVMMYLESKRQDIGVKVNKELLDATYAGNHAEADK